MALMWMLWARRKGSGTLGKQDRDDKAGLLDVDVSKNSGFYPLQIIHCNRVFQYLNHPLWGVFPLFLETPMYVGNYIIITFLSM